MCFAAAHDEQWIYNKNQQQPQQQQKHLNKIQQ